MLESSFLHTETMVVVTCVDCGVLFGITESHRDQLIKSGDTFYCPNGHSQIYSRKQNLEQQIKQLNTQLKYTEKDRDFYKKSLTLQKGQVTKLKKRIANGVCPCCHRSFVSLSQHIKTQHPDYQKEE